MPPTLPQSALKAPHSINFSKKNPIHPFDADPTHGINSLEFFSGKNDASLFVVGTHNKKRPNGLTFVRCFDGRVLDMIEVGVEGIVGMKDIKVRYFAFLRLFSECMILIWEGFLQASTLR